MWGDGHVCEREREREGGREMVREREGEAVYQTVCRGRLVTSCQFYLLL